MQTTKLGGIALLLLTSTGCETLRSGLHEEAVQIAKEAVAEAISEHCERDAQTKYDDATHERWHTTVDNHKHEID